MTGSQSQHDSSSSAWFSGLVAGESLAVQELWDTYFQRLVLLAKTRLHGGRRAVRDEEDIALSAFKSFCLGVRRGEYSSPLQSSSLWPLLVSITLNKVRDQVRSDNRQKRGGPGRAGTAKISINLISDCTELAALAPPPDLQAAAKDTLQHVLDCLDATGDEQLAHIAIASVEGFSAQEIADELNCTTRTIQRKRKTIRAIWELASQ